MTNVKKTIPPLDLLFLLTETAASPKHVGAVLLFARPPSGDPGFVGSIVAAYRNQPPVPPFNFVPELVNAGMPRFRTAEDFDPAYHVQHLALPAGATHSTFLSLVADLHEPLLDRDRPLFRIWAIEGLPDGMFALYMKIHHAVIDGASGAQRIFGSLSASAAGKLQPPPFALELSARRPRPPKGLTDQLRSIRTSATHQALALKDISLGALRKGIAGLAGAGMRGSLPFIAPRTPMNAPLTMARSFATLSLPLAEMRAVGKAFGATLNDVAATIVDEGVHRYLRATGRATRDPLVAMCPMSLREEGDTEAATKASAMFVPLGTPDATVVDRVGQVVASMATAKEELRAMSKDAAMLYAIAAFGLAELAVAIPGNRVTRPLANFVLSNVPGARHTLYLNGARLVGNFPISALAANIGLNATLASYGDTMDFGFVGNGTTMKGMPEVAAHTAAAYAELKAAALPAKATAAKAGPRRTPRPKADIGGGAGRSKRVGRS